jgi:hypothetical protein
MQQARDLELLIADKKVDMKKAGILLDDSIFVAIEQRVKEINALGGLTEPATVAEMLKLYSRMLHELITARNQEIADRIAKDRKKNVVIRSASDNSSQTESVPKTPILRDLPHSHCD